MNIEKGVHKGDGCHTESMGDHCHRGADGGISPVGGGKNHRIQPKGRTESEEGENEDFPIGTQCPKDENKEGAGAEKKDEEFFNSSSFSCS